MSVHHLDQLIDTAISEGILPQGTQRPTNEQRPWPVILLTALGAWLVAIPLALFVAFVANGMLIEGVGPYLVGGLILTCMVVLLRMDTLPLFSEQFTVPGLRVGGATLGYGLDRDLGSIVAAVLMALLALAIAARIRRNWLRVLLGGAACGCILMALVPLHDRAGSFISWLAVHIVLGVWVLAQWLCRNQFADTRRAALLEGVALGWVLVILAALAFSAGTTFLVEATLRAGDFKSLSALSFGIPLLCSGALAACAGAWLAHCWPSLRQWWCGMAALVLIALAAQMPPLGATLLVLAIFCAARRWRLAIAAGAAAAWIIGAFYYQFSTPLATKALMMAGAGAHRHRPMRAGRTGCGQCRHLSEGDPDRPRSSGVRRIGAG